jgi:8-oxo-dGTP diphosphatase
VNSPDSFPPVICTVDIVLLTIKDERLHVALWRREREPYDGIACLPGGFIHANEDTDARAAALRVMREKTRIEMPYLEQLATFSGQVRDPRGWSVSIAHYALLPFALIDPGQHAEQPEHKLYDVDQLPPLPFDHRTIIDAAVARLRSKSQYSSLPCYLLGESFTLPQLQKLYETLMGEAINKVSFRRKMAEMDFLEAIEGQMEAAGAHRPAQLHRLKPEYRDRLRLLNRGF